MSIIILMNIVSFTNTAKGENQMKIDKGIAITSARAKYPWRQMEIGDSVFFDNEPKASQSKPSIASKVFERTNADYKFASRKEGNGVRIWRVE